MLLWLHIWGMSWGGRMIWRVWFMCFCFWLRGICLGRICRMFRMEIRRLLWERLSRRQRRLNCAKICLKNLKNTLNMWKNCILNQLLIINIWNNCFKNWGGLRELIILISLLNMTGLWLKGRKNRSRRKKNREFSN